MSAGTEIQVCNAGGRPTDYDPKYCDLILELGREGKSKAQMAAHIGITRKTIENWADRHPEFREALDLWQDLCLAWWENTGQRGLAHGVMNAAVWGRSMAARFHAEYREETAIVGAGGGPILTQHVDNLTDEQLAVIALAGRAASAESETGAD